jgi:hypothetical protein
LTRSASHPSLNHPNICPLYDVGHQDGIDYRVMEFLGRGYQNKRTTPLPSEGGRNFSHGRADRHGCREIHCTPPRETRASFRFWEGDDSSFAPAQSEVEGVPQVQQEQSRLDPLRNRGLHHPTLEASRCP